MKAIFAGAAAKISPPTVLARNYARIPRSPWSWQFLNFSSSFSNLATSDHGLRHSKGMDLNETNGTAHETDHDNNGTAQGTAHETAQKPQSITKMSTSSEIRPPMQ